jgi:predicted glycogen debranching enzyme
MTMLIDDRTEWLEPDGLGGFASGTTSGVRTRRYHALLLTATTPPTGRVVLVNGCEAWLDTASGTFALTTQRYTPDVLYPDGASRIMSFFNQPWPTWVLDLPNGTRIIQEVFVQHGLGTTVLSWRAENIRDSPRLRVRLLLSGRDYHATHHENGAFRFEAERTGAAVTFRPYADIPSIVCLSNGAYEPMPEWYRQFLYSAERERGLDDTEDLASPGVFTWQLTDDSPRAIVLLKPGGTSAPMARSALEVLALADSAGDAERTRRMGFRAPLDRSADAYLVQRGSGRTVVAGYPWFTDWGRDTFIALRGLCLTTGRLVDARDILVEWASAVSDEMLPNRFPDRGEAPEFNSVDAALWYVIAVHDLIAAAASDPVLSRNQRATLDAAVVQIITGYARGTRFGIRMDKDGLLAAGSPGVQLTWMDARVGDRVITPRIGKPVEIQALWLNALQIASGLDSSWRAWLGRGQASFITRFWNDERGYLADVVDVDHVPNTHDETFRPNQILAVGGLPMSLIRAHRARRIVDEVERRLVTPLGLRSLAPEEPGYAPRYEGDSSARDAVYHQGTVWPWLMGPFVDAWVRVRTDQEAARREARQQFVTPLIAHLESAGLGHVSEIADAEAPFTPRGCPFQAWSLGELLRIDRVVLADRQPATQARGVQPQSAATTL